MMVRWSGEVQVNVSGMSVECQVNFKSQSELDIGGRETCLSIESQSRNFYYQFIQLSIRR